MVKQFYTSVRAAFKSVPLPFIHIYHPASFHSTGTPPLLTPSSSEFFHLCISPSSSTTVLPSTPFTHPLADMSLFNPTICLSILNTVPLPSSSSNISQYLCLSSS